MVGFCLVLCVRAARGDEVQPQPTGSLGAAATGGDPAPPEVRAGDQTPDPEAGNAPEEKPIVSPQRAPPQPWKIMFYDNDFSDKGAPDHARLFGEELKDIPLDGVGPFSWLPETSRLSYGGEVRYRLMDERNRLRPPATPGHSDYDLVRWRQYLDLHVSDDFRAYVEMLDASFDRGQLPPLASDVNRWDLFNAFVDVRIAEVADQPVYVRTGRQTLIYGSYRLLAPSMFGNSPQNFDGVKLFSPGETWDVDAFLTRPVVINADHFDSPNQNDVFAGVWGVYKGWRKQTVDLYWLWNKATIVPAGFMGGNRHTLGGRWIGHRPIGDDDDPDRVLHGEFEGAWQFGSQGDKAVEAGFFTAGAGHTWNSVPWKPDAWLYLDWASGNRNPNGGTINTFDQLFPWTHRFLGLIDNVGRQNIIDLNGKVILNPTDKLALETAGHWFNLASGQDVLYTVSGAPIGTPGNGRSVGEELDIVGTYTFSPNFNVQLAWFRFWYGSFIERTAPRGPASLFYVQTTFNY